MKAFLLSLSVLLAFTRENNGKPNVYRLPRYPSVYVGDDVSLKCNGIGEQITWKLNGKQLQHKDSLMALTMVTPANSGDYSCQRNGQESDSYTLTVLVLEPHAQLSLPPGGAVIGRGEARVLTLQVDEELDKWKCYAFRGNAGFVINIMPDGINTARVYADLQESQRATFWCMKAKSSHRSNVVTLMMTERMVMLEPATVVLKEQALTLRCTVWGGAKVEEAEFYHNGSKISTEGKDFYTIKSATDINNGQYRCNATYKFSHINPEAAKYTKESDPQQIKVIDGPPAASLAAKHKTELECSCAACKDCETYQWHHTDISKTRKRLNEADKIIYITEPGSYTCRADCSKGFSRFSNVHNYKAGEPGGGGTVVVLLVAIVVFLGLIFIVTAVIIRLRHRNRTTVQIKDDGKKDKSGGDYEQIGLKDKAIYHTLAESTGKEKTEGGYEALEKKDDDKAVYHTLGAAEGPSQAEGQGGYEALQTVKAQVYQTLSSGSGKPEGEAEGGYEQLPQKDVTAEENPYEELKAEKQKKEATREKE